jgi:hypothetical protein
LNDQWSEIDNELTAFVSFNHDLIGGHFKVLICEDKLRFEYFDFVTRWIFNHDWVRAAFPHSTDKFKLLDVLALFNSNLELVEDVLASSLLFEVDDELVNACSQGKEVEFVLLVGLASDIKCVGAADKKPWVGCALDLPTSFKPLGLLGPVFDFHDEVLLFLCLDSFLDDAFCLGGRGRAFEVV